MPEIEGIDKETLRDLFIQLEESKRAIEAAQKFLEAAENTMRQIIEPLPSGTSKNAEEITPSPPLFMLREAKIAKIITAEELYRLAQSSEHLPAGTLYINPAPIAISVKADESAEDVIIKILEAAAADLSVIQDKTNILKVLEASAKTLKAINAVQAYLTREN